MRVKNRGIIEFGDDLVVVKDSAGNDIFRGREDYEPYKDEPWEWDDKKGVYRWNGLIKYRVA